MNAQPEMDWRYWLFEWVDDFRRTRDPSLLSRPTTESGVQLRTLQAAVAEALAMEARLPVPDWCRSVPALREPWFVSGVENLKASALVESPLPFRRRNIFVLANFLERI